MTAAQTMDYTGERMVPEASDGLTFWEHVERYRFALPFIKGRRVLDIACGEGYGCAAMLDAGATSVIGVDVSEEACVHARAKYGVETIQGNAEAIPLSDGSVDAVVSFETIEHLQDVSAFVRECDRVLAPGGQLIISTPNLPVYHQRAPDNPFHVHEMGRDEFQRLLTAHFPRVRFFGQHLPLSLFWRARSLSRLVSAYYRIVAPHVIIPPSAVTTASVGKQIQRPATWRDHFDPYRVRTLSEERMQRATYLVAIADRP
jgi:ubiquinone/menaquinone biosynthesis C-methylase UbiE